MTLNLSWHCINLQVFIVFLLEITPQSMYLGTFLFAIKRFVIHNRQLFINLQQVSFYRLGNFLSNTKTLGTQGAPVNEGP